MAARALSVGQPSITTHIKSLEDSNGVELFSRHGHTVELTDIGCSLLAITKRIFSLEKEAAELLDAASGLKIGNLKISAIGPFQVTEMILAFGQKFPDVELSVSFGNSQEVLDGLFDFTGDVAVLARVKDDHRLFSIPYGDYQVVILAGNDHPWGQRKEINIEELGGQRMIFREVGSATRRVFEKKLEESGVSIRRVLEISSREAMIQAVAKGIGIGIALEEEISKDKRLKSIKVTNADITIHSQVVCLQERRNSPLIKAFLSVVKDLIAIR